MEVVKGNASDTDLITADEVMALADGKFSISLSTDIVYTRDVAYDTKVKYDEDKSSSYKKVTTKGVNGEEELHLLTVFRPMQFRLTQKLLKRQLTKLL